MTTAPKPTNADITKAGEELGLDEYDLMALFSVGGDEETRRKVDERAKQVAARRHLAKVVTLPDKPTLDRLRELERAATPGPWTKAVMGGVMVGELRENTHQFASGSLGELFQIECENGHYIGREDLDEDSAEAQANRDETFLVESRNALPSLLAAAERALELESFLREHGERLRQTRDDITALLDALREDLTDGS